MYSANEALIAWTPSFLKNHPTRGQVEVGPLLKNTCADWTAPYYCTGGAASVERRELVGDVATGAVFQEFITLVVRDGIDPVVAHNAFCKIDDYAHCLTEDTPGYRPTN